MHRPRFTAWTRRALLTQAGGLAAIAFLPHFPAFSGEAGVLDRSDRAPVAAPSLRQQIPAAPLIDGVTAVCQRLASSGWRDLLLQVSGDELDIAAAHLAETLARPLSRIDRTVPGFKDFALEGRRGSNPAARPAACSTTPWHRPTSSGWRRQRPAAFPTPAELEAVENYVYGSQPPRSTHSAPRPAAVHWRWSFLPSSIDLDRKRFTVSMRTVASPRTGHARLGTVVPNYDARRREFRPFLADDPFAFPVQPVRYAPFLAVQRRGDPDAFGPLRATEDDRSRRFWVPLHKLFSGSECLRGLHIKSACPPAISTRSCAGSMTAWRTLASHRVERAGD